MGSIQFDLLAMLKENKTTVLKKDTTTVTVIRLGRNIVIRLPRFVTPPLVVLAGAILACVAIFPYTSTVQTFDLPKEGEASSETIIAPFTFDILKSKEELQRERAEARNQVLLVFDRDHERRKAVRHKLGDLRELILLLSDKETDDSAGIAARAEMKKELSENTIAVLVERPYLLDDAMFQAEQMLNAGISSVLLIRNMQELQELSTKYNTEFGRYVEYDKAFVTLRDSDTTEMAVKHETIPVKEVALDVVVQTLKVERMFDQEALNSLYELLDIYVQPNIVLNGEEEQRRRLAASNAVLANKGKVIKDTEIVRKHQEVTPEIVEKLRSLHAVLEGKAHGGETVRILTSNMGQVFLVVLFLVSVGLYVRFFHADLLGSLRHLVALASIVVLQVLIIRCSLLLVPGFFGSGREITGLVPEYIIPVAVGSILVTILFGIKLSFVVTLFVAVYFGVVESFSFSLFIFALLGGFAASVSTNSIRYRWDFFKAMPPIMLTHSAFIVLWHMISYRMMPLEVVQNIGLGIINCTITIFLSMMFAAIFENLFDVTTDMTLVELSDMNHPLLKKLSIEAAGTYNHSVLVANLAESAAERIGASALLARVASYYHDVGKIAKPNYFVENQIMEKNIHDKLSPSMSALIISSHVKEGVDMAVQHKLPSVIKNAILQHHGDSKVSFFYEKAVEQDHHKQVEKKDYQYPGPRPQTRENAIILLADAVEAASRSLSTSSPKMLRSFVKKIIHDKFASSQLDECNLTFRDLDKIVEGFMPVLQGIFHTRIEYPSKK